MQAPPQRPHRRTGAARDAGLPDDSRSSARPTMRLDEGGYEDVPGRYTDADHRRPQEQPVGPQEGAAQHSREDHGEPQDHHMPRRVPPAQVAHHNGERREHEQWDGGDGAHGPGRDPEVALDDVGERPDAGERRTEAERRGDQRHGKSDCDVRSSDRTTLGCNRFGTGDAPRRREGDHSSFLPMDSFWDFRSAIFSSHFLMSS